MDSYFYKTSGSLVLIANQTKPDIPNNLQAIARFSHGPKEKREGC